MDERLETWIAAERLIAQYGPEADSVAKERARSLRLQGGRIDTTPPRCTHAEKPDKN